MTFRRALPGRFALLGCFALFFLAACAETPDLPGKYQATTQDDVLVTLILKETGLGEWNVEGEQAVFSWKWTKNKLWLRAKQGGVITGVLTDTGLVLDIPGEGRLNFSKL